MRCELCWNTIHDWEPSHHGVHLLCILRAQEENPRNRDEGPHSTDDHDYREGYDR
jgi:hypothetical protein